MLLSSYFEASRGLLLRARQIGSGQDSGKFDPKYAFATHFAVHAQEFAVHAQVRLIQIFAIQNVQKVPHSRGALKVLINLPVRCFAHARAVRKFATNVPVGGDKMRCPPTLPLLLPFFSPGVGLSGGPGGEPNRTVATTSYHD